MRKGDLYAVSEKQHIAGGGSDKTETLKEKSLVFTEFHHSH